MAKTFTSDRSWGFDVGVDELWERLTAVDEYPTWWPWLRRFDADGGFATDSRWDCVVAPPLPYVVRFSIELDQVEPRSFASATVQGDIRGHAELRIEPDRSGRSRARLTSSLAPADPLLRRVASVASPLVQWGHDWVLDQGRRQFVERGIAPAGGLGPGAEGH